MTPDQHADYERVLRSIAAEDPRPCRKCGEPHEPWRDPREPKLAPQWSKNGHAFHEISILEYVRAELARIDGEA